MLTVGVPIFLTKQPSKKEKSHPFFSQLLTQNKCYSFTPLVLSPLVKELFYLYPKHTSF